MSGNPIYKRVLLKLSGEALLGNREYGIDPDFVGRIANEAAQIINMGVQLCIVVGGGNIFRGVAGAAKGMDRVTADYMGMLATVVNGLAIQTAFGNAGVDARVLSAIPMDMVCETYIRRRALSHLNKGRAVIFVAGSGNPFFTTDTPAALRATEMGCDALLKATKVDGVYDKDPAQFPDAKRFEKLNYIDVLSRDLRVMDASAISLARENNIPIVVFSIQTPGALGQVIRGEGKFTLVSEEKVENGRVCIS